MFGPNKKIKNNANFLFFPLDRLGRFVLISICWLIGSTNQVGTKKMKKQKIAAWAFKSKLFAGKVLVSVARHLEIGRAYESFHHSQMIFSF